LEKLTAKIAEDTEKLEYVFAFFAVNNNLKIFIQMACIVKQHPSIQSIYSDNPVNCT